MERPGFTGSNASSVDPEVLGITGTYVSGELPWGWYHHCEDRRIPAQRHLSVWTSGTSNDEYGTFILTMAADNQSWVGYAKSHDRGDDNDPNNWVGRR
jgi:hypothetical protein